MRIINSLANTKFDPKVVTALMSAFERGQFYPRSKPGSAPAPEVAIPAGKLAAVPAAAPTRA